MNSDSAAALTGAARALVRARSSGNRLVRLDPGERPRSHADAAAIIRTTVELLGAEIGGWKIGHSAKGLTFGPILQPLVFDTGSVISASPCAAVGLEGEIAAKLICSPLSRPSDALGSCIETLHPAIEIIAPRFISVSGVSPFEAEADLGLNGGAVVGVGKPFSLDYFEPTKVSVCIGDRQVFASVSASERMPPLEALMWLAEMLDRVGLVLEAGHLVLLGARTGMLPVTPPGEIKVDMDALGGVTCLLAAPADIVGPALDAS